VVGVSKERRAVTLEPDVDEYLAQPHVNASGLVNDLVKRHMNGDDTGSAIREFRIRQLEEEAEEYENRAERKLEEAERLKAAEAAKEEEREDKIEAAAESLPEKIRDPENPAVETQAAKVGLEPDELLAELEERDL